MLIKKDIGDTWEFNKHRRAFDSESLTLTEFPKIFGFKGVIYRREAS